MGSPPHDPPSVDGACPRCGQARDWRGVCPACVLHAMLRAPGGEARDTESEGANPVDPASPIVGLPRFPRAFAERFELRAEIGAGGSGRVWRAFQRELDREVALKTLRLGAGEPGTSQQRLRREAQLVARLRHPGIVALHEVGECDGEPFLVMELVRGESLAQRLLAGPLPPRRAASLVRELADAVDHAHQHHIIHRDLKPSNVLLDSERGEAPRLTDFGIARFLPDPEALTATGEGLGTASYLAPEQASLERDRQGPTTDVYGLGAVLFHSLTGRAPFVGESAAAVIRAVLEADPPALRSLNPTIPRDLETVCLRCLEKEPRRRYATVAELRADLGRFLANEPVLARPVGTLGRAWRWCRRRPELTVTLTAALALLLALGVVRERSQRQLSRTVTQLELQRAGTLFRDGQVAEGMAQLAATARRDPGSSTVGARLWSALSHRPWIRPLGVLNEGTNRVARIGTDPQGHWVVWSPAEGQLEVRHAAGWEPVGARRRFSAYPLQMGILPETKLAYVLGANGVLAFWDPRNGREVRVPSDGLSVVAVSAAEVAPGVAVARSSGEILIFRPGQEEAHAPPLEHGPGLRGVHLSGQGDRVVSWGSEGDWKLWDCATGVRLAAGNIPRPFAVEIAQLSPRGQWLVIAGTDGRLELLDARQGRAMGEHRVEGRPTGVAFAANLDRVLTSDIGGTVQLLEIANGWRPLARWSSPAVVAALHRDAQGDRVVGCTVQGQWRVWDLAAARPASEWFSHGHGTRGAAFLHGGELLTLSRENELRRWQSAPVPPFEEGAVPAAGFWNDYAAQRIAFVGSSRFLVAARSAQAHLFEWTPAGLRTNRVLDRGTPLIERVQVQGELALVWSPLHADAEVWDLAGGGPPRRLDSRGERVSAAAWIANGTGVTLATANGTVQRIELGAGGQTRELERAAFRELPPEVNPDGSLADNNLRRGEAHRFSQLRPSPNGQWLAAVGTDHAVHRWDLGTGRRAGPALPFLYIATCVAWSPDSEAFAVASWAYTAQVFSARSGEPLGPPLTHKDGVSHVEFSPDGTRVVTASLDGTARLWNWRTGEPVGPPLAHDADVGMASYSPDQRWVLTSSMDGTARIWDATTGLAASEPLSVVGSSERALRDVVFEARFSPDSRHVAVLHRSGRVAVFAWEVPRHAVPAWVPEIAESLGGQRLDARGLSEAAPGLPITRPAVRSDGPGSWSAWLDRVYGAPR